MTFRTVASRVEIKRTFNLYVSKIRHISEKISNLETPERIKGTFLERWGKYWKNLYLDYKDTTVNVVKESKEHPIRASVYISLLGACYYLAKHNPDECSYEQQLIEDSIRLMQVGESVRNPVAVHHVKWMGQCFDEGIVRRLNLGLMSLIWLDNYDRAVCLYKAVCPYLKPRYITFHKRVVDIGFMDKWWILNAQMKDYDINEDEFV